MKYKNFELDDFQVESIKSLDKNHSVVVSAATGTGKTLIADYLIDKELKIFKKVIYTAPIKALSNQKYRQFKKEYGEDRIGIMTGDVVINPKAEVLIMTTEIYRNMLLSNDPLVETISYVIFDEIHFISDVQRGIVWEESVIFSPKHIRFLCLSATIPNAEEFAGWITKIKDHKVDVVKNAVRAVPLTHHFFDEELGITDLKSVKKIMEHDQLSRYGKRGRKKRRAKIPIPKHYHLVEEMQDRGELPCIFFVFSRAKTEKYAKDLTKSKSYLSKKQRMEVSSLIHEEMKNQDPQLNLLESTRMLKNILAKGVGVHHAGLLPVQKTIVEKLFGMGLVKVLYTTETFALGLNYPAKSVCFDSLEKFDGINIRYLNSKEYFQMAGRAGRRGIDDHGVVVAMIDRRFADIKRIKKLTSEDSEPIKSHFRLSANTVLNMINNHTENEIQEILKSNFNCYLDQKLYKNVSHLFEKRKKTLQKMGYLKGDQLTDKGIFASRIYTKEILVSELFTSDTIKQLDPKQLAVIIGIIVYEYRRNDKFKMELSKKEFKTYHDAISINSFVKRAFNFKNLEKLNLFITSWYDECSFIDLMDITSYNEGSIIRFFRQMIDLIEQIKKATEDKELKDKLDYIKTRIDREFVAVVF